MEARLSRDRFWWKRRVSWKSWFSAGSGSYTTVLKLLSAAQARNASRLGPGRGPRRSALYLNIACEDIEKSGSPTAHTLGAAGSCRFISVELVRSSSCFFWFLIFCSLGFPCFFLPIYLFLHIFLLSFYLSFFLSFLLSYVSLILRFSILSLHSSLVVFVSLFLC